VTSHGTIYRVIDADTLMVNISDNDVYHQLVREAAGDEDRLRYFNDRFQSIRIRLANVDTPESVHRDKSRNTPIYLYSQKNKQG
jgi:endonuclease YncB( thermonuclease family)